MATSLSLQARAKGKPWVLPVLIVVLAAVTVLGGSFAAAGSRLGSTGTGASVPSAPPSAVFMVVWLILYVLMGAAMGYQAFTASSAAHWTSLALLAGTVVVAWVWPAIWAAAQRSQLPWGSPTWVIAAMIVVGGTALTLVPNSTTAALWAPFLLWLVVALGLSMQSQALRPQGPTSPIGSSSRVS